MARYMTTLANIYPGASAQAFGNSSQTVMAPVGGITNAPGGAINAPSGIPITQLFAGWYGSILGQPLLWLFGAIGLLVLYKLLEEHLGGREIFAEVKIGLNNFVKIGLMALIFIVIGKLIFTRYTIPGITSLFQAA